MAYPSVAFQPTTSFMGLQPIAATSTTQAHPLGTIVKATDFTYGEGEFIYLLGVASTVAGSLVCYNSKTGATVLAVHGGATSVGPAAVAMSANVASQYGWYCVSGSVPVKSGTVAANTAAYLTSTAGQVDDAVVAGDEVNGATLKAADSGGFATCQLSRPAVDGSGGSSTPDYSAVAASIVPSSDEGFNLGATGKRWANVYASQYSDTNGAVRITPTASTTTLYRDGDTGPTSSTVAHDFATKAALPTGAKIARFKNLNTEKAFIDDVGNVEVTTVGSGFILKSPDGTRYRITVANGGALSTTAA